MEPTAIGLKLASSVIGPLVKKFFVADAPGAGLVDNPIRLGGYVSFKGEKRTRLTHLSLDPASFEALPAGLVLENLTFLTLNSHRPAHPAMLERLPGLVPRLGSLNLRGNLSAGGRLDITALAALPGLREVTLDVPRARLRGATALPTSVRVETDG